MPDFFYGGQALIEGVMMRGRTTVAMSVRPPSGEIKTMSEPLPAALSADRRLIKIPFLRGVFLLYETLVIGTRMLMRSAAIAAEGEDIELGKGTIAMTMVFSLGFAIGLFFLLPLFLSTFAEDATSSDFAANAVEGLIRLGIFVAYIAAIGMMSDIKRVFAYHGAEHKAISAYEADEPLTPDEVDAFGTAHTRCGTTFILIVVVISIFFFSLVPASRRAAPAALPVADRARPGHRRLRLRARPLRRASLRQPARARALRTRALAPVADHAASGPFDARGQHRQPRVLPRRRSRGGRRRERHDRPARRAGGPLRGREPPDVDARGRHRTPPRWRTWDASSRASSRSSPTFATGAPVHEELDRARTMVDDPDEGMRTMAREEIDAPRRARRQTSSQTFALHSSRAIRTTTAT